MLLVLVVEVERQIAMLTVAAVLVEMAAAALPLLVCNLRLGVLLPVAAGVGQITHLRVRQAERVLLVAVAVVVVELQQMVLLLTLVAQAVVDMHEFTVGKEINMNYAKIENGLITNVVVADATFAAEHGLVEFPTYINDKAVGIGWKHDGTNFTEPDPVVAPVVIAPTKEELMVELAALTAKIQALE
jgi:hypothetical protein